MTMTDTNEKPALPALSISNLSATYAGNRALDIAAFSLAPGEVVGVVGANGAGKSTLVNAIAGWSRGDVRVQGRVELIGQDVSAQASHLRARDGLLLVPEGKLVFGTMTVEDNLDVADTTRLGDGRRAYSREDVYRLFPRLRERRAHLGSQLSGGERQMLGIARALMLGPRVLLLDEPSIGLAPKLVADVLRTVRTLAQEGIGVLIAEQNVRAAIEFVDRLVLLERGRILAQGPASQMRDDPRIAEVYLGARVALKASAVLEQTP